MHPSFTDHMTTTRIEQFRREAIAMQRANHAKNNTGSSSLAHNLRYVFFGLNIPVANQKRGDTYSLQSIQTRINGIMWMIGCIALGLGLLIGSFINSNFGLLPIALVCCIILIIVTLPIVTRSASLLSKHTHAPSHR